MIWQNVVLLVAGGWFGRVAYVREVARRRGGKTFREAILPRNKAAERKLPSVTEVAG